MNCKSTATNSKSQQEILELCQITVCGLKKINVKRKKSDVLDAKHAKSIQHIHSS